MSLSPGTRLGHYDVTALIGEGGMGQVWQATDTTLNRQVALKILPDAFADDPDRLARFQREAQVLASLNHPNIAAIHGIEEDEVEGRRALVLELVEGPTLADRIEPGPIPIDEALPIAKQIAEALEAAHEQGVIHRDLKPANVKVKADGTVKVLDFGLAKAFQPDASDASASLSPTISLTAAATQMGMVIGTAAYMAPEQAKGKPVDKRADIWAFGAVLFEMLSGQRPFAGDDVSDTLAAVLRIEANLDQLPDDVPPRIRQIIGNCLQKDPRRRLRDIGDVALAMEGAFDTPTSAPEPHAAVEAPALRPWQRPVPLAIATVVIAAIAGLGVWIVTRPDVVPTDLGRFVIVTPERAPLGRSVGRAELAVSRDGTQIVYGGVTEDGGRQLHLRPIDQFVGAPLRGGEGGGAPFVSPNGEWVGFQTSGTSLRKVSILGGSPVTLTESPLTIRGASWGTDDQIIFGTQVAGLFRVSGGGGQPEALTTLNAEQGESGHQWPSIIPGANAVLFVIVADSAAATGQLAMLDLETRGVTRLGLAGTGPRYVSTGHLVYAAEDGSVRAVRFDPTQPETTGSPVPVLDGVWVTGFGAAYFSISDTGRLVYVPGVDGGDPAPALVWVDRDGTVERIETIPGGTTPRLSPEGGRVLLEADGDLWIYDVVSGRASRVTRDGESVRGTWDSTGARVAYSSSRGGSQQVWVEPADASGEPRQGTDLEGGRVHVDSWSRDGRTLVVHQHTGGPIKLLTLPMDGATAEPAVFLEREFSTLGAVFSPDGRYVAYHSQETGQGEIYIRPYPGPGGQQTASVGGGQQPVWAANGELFYRDLTGERMLLVAVTTEPSLVVGTPRQLFQGRFYNLLPGGSPRPQYDVTADGQRFLMVEAGTAESRPQINVVLNWTQELLERVPVP